MRKLLLFFSLFVAFSMHSQEYFPTNTGVKTTMNKVVAFKNATIYVTPKKVIKKGTLLVKDGKVVAVGKSVSIPKGTEIIDLAGKTIYPSFIDIYSSFGITKPKSNPTSRRSGKPQYDASRKGFYWNDHIRPETKAANSFKFDDKKATDYLKAGFGVVNTHLQDGIVRGNGLLVALNSNSSDAYRILENTSAQYLSFSKSALSKQSYPTSKMGAMALLRQMYLDAKWYADGNTKNSDQSLEALNTNKNLLQIFEASSWLDVLRADKIGDEFNIQYTILGGGDEYERINEIKKTNASLIIPINFQDAYDVSNPLIAKQIPLSDMRKWNQEPSNLSVLAKNGINFALTTHKLKSVNSFHKNLQKAIKYGFNKEKALESLTTTPAKLLSKTTIGNLNIGSYANFIITSGDVFDSKTTIYENWVQGDKNVINDMNLKDITGDYNVSVNGKNYALSITGKGTKQIGAVKLNDEKVKSKFSFKDGWIHLTIMDNGYTRLIGQIINASNVMQGTAYDEAGNESNWSASKTFRKDSKKKKEDKKKEDAVTLLPVSYPNVGYGNFTLPKQETILIKNATVWTSEDEGILENTDVLIKDGKIEKIGQNLKSSRAKVIDGTGKYLTAGIIDEHSHIATSAVNEAGHNSTAEVSIEDVVNPTDMNIYRNLAGGVTSIQILHGSANPIGGRSAIIKLKWGENAEGLIYKDSPKFIKFALGENVKQSNWGENNNIRFPQTRMGTEQVFIDYFQRAKEYDALKKSGKPYRKDIELETLAEIINKERFISCHSYVQSEINMLMKVADKFNFNINTFTHILEGYKVADKMKEHGVGASTFSDWWAYKYEVLDAIPYNAAILANQGITVAINSDDREMSRRLNQEAAKTIKYGGMSELEAWKMVTINPAKLLHLDNRTGSIKVGKDGDVVLWSHNPLSIYAKAEKTIIDGTIYFDIEKDLEKRESIKNEKSKLLKMMLSEKMKGGKTVMPKKKRNQNFHCDSE
ncbi:amidohydrolase family protein [Polaribacter sp. SA4-12]|uniref:amidohydrolase family protein n=1 Tax=Polaribacter sp. SA4-12 TaxID=1312072 RepID=UPI000B3D26C1|nr:amidohydrolase family protein [Polaribacter sp. SA4-12]ARV14316.1 amidohydrolase [Polaribacter sp. SA4-12]